MLVRVKGTLTRPYDTSCAPCCATACAIRPTRGPTQRLDLLLRLKPCLHTPQLRDSTLFGNAVPAICRTGWFESRRVAFVSCERLWQVLDAIIRHFELRSNWSTAMARSRVTSIASRPSSVVCTGGHITTCFGFEFSQLDAFLFTRSVTFPPSDGQSENGRVDFRRESKYG